MRFNSDATYCDDYNVASGDGCDDHCGVEEGFYCLGGSSTSYDVCYEDCGDGMRFTDASVSAFCDDGNNVDGDGCDSICAVEEGFYCLGGSTSSIDLCYEICGDGLDFEEFECDDGNAYDYDGCDSDCLIESGWDCEGGSSS